MSDRPRRRVGPWERRRLAGIFSAFQALFLLRGIFEKYEKQFDRSQRAERTLSTSRTTVCPERARFPALARSLLHRSSLW